MDFFSYEDYRALVKDKFKQKEKKGRGEFKRLAELLNISAVYVSQVFSGDRELSLDQGWGVCRFLNLTDLQTKYFMLLVEREKASNKGLKDFFSKQLEEIRLKSLDLKNRLPQDMQMTNEQKAIFYSTWFYSAIRIATSIEEMQDADKIAKRLELPVHTVTEVLDFLLQTGMCVYDQNRIKMGPSFTHLEKSSPYIKARQTVWRLRAIEKMDVNEPQQLFYTAPMSVSKNDLLEIRSEIAQLIEKILARVANSKAQDLACLNIDWFVI